MEAVLAGCFLDELPERLIGDKAYDSDSLDEQLAEEYGMEMIAPNRSNRKQKTQDGRPLRRYRRRWKVERLFAWMQNYRRLVTRWEYRRLPGIRPTRISAYAVQTFMWRPVSN